VLSKEAMGVNIFRRGFSDNNLFVAYNTRSKVTPTKVQFFRVETKAILASVFILFILSKLQE